MKKLLFLAAAAACTASLAAQTKPVVAGKDAKAAEAAVEESMPSAPATDHFLRAGILATTNFYQDKALPQGLVNGNYRPYASYAYNDKYSFMVRGNFALKYYPEKPAAVERQVNAVGILEITSFEGKFGNHSITAGRSYYQTEQGILFANFADGAQ